MKKITKRAGYADSACVFVILMCWLLFYLPLIGHIKFALVDNDWYQSYYYADSFRKSIFEYRQFPLRNPFFAGGYPSIAHPFDISLNPLSLLVLVFGAVSGSTITALLLSLLGALGMFYLTRNVLKYGSLGSLFSTLLFMLSKWGLNMISDGNFQKLYYWLLPWLLAFIIKAKDDKRHIVFTGFLLYLIIVQGGFIIIPVVLFLFLFSLLKGRSFLAVFLSVIIFSACLSAVKIIPLWQLNKSRVQYIHLPSEDTYAEISRLSKFQQKSLDWGSLRRSLFERNFYDLPSAVYFGYTPLILCISALLIYRRQLWRCAFLLIVFIFISMGANAPVDIFRWVWHVNPIVHGIWKLDKYFTVFLVFLISLMAGRFFSVFDGLSEKMRHFRIFAYVLIIFCALDMFMANRVYYKAEIAYASVPESKPQKSFFQVKLKEAYKQDAQPKAKEDIRSYRAMWYLLRDNVGLVDYNWEGNIRIKEAAIPKYIVDTVVIKEKKIGETAVPGYELNAKSRFLPENANPSYKGEVFFLNSDNEAVLSYFTPNIINIEVKMKSADTLVINQNYHGGWLVNCGRVFDYNGLLAIGLKDIGSYTIRLVYAPLDFYAGLVITIFALSFGIIFLKRKRC